MKAAEVQQQFVVDGRGSGRQAAGSTRRIKWKSIAIAARDRRPLHLADAGITQPRDMAVRDRSWS